MVPETARGVRLDVFLKDRALAGLSRARLQQLIEIEAILLDGRATRPALKLKGGEEVLVRVPEPTPMHLAPAPLSLDVLYEDSHVIGLCKPAGLVVHPGAGTHDEPTLVHGLLAHCGDLSGIGGVQRPGVVHRLDCGTSGVMIVAKHDQAHQGLAAQFSGRTATKRYVALVLGAPAQPQATLDTLYGRHPVHRQRFSSRVGAGKRAVTRYRVLGSAFGLAALDVLLGTGRTHQIRVHLADLGHPVLGDPMYGGRQSARVTEPGLRAMAAALRHQALHAARLELTHPMTGAPLVLQAPPPASWHAILKGVIDAH